MIGLLVAGYPRREVGVSVVAVSMIGFGLLAAFVAGALLVRRQVTSGRADTAPGVGAPPEPAGSEPTKSGTGSLFEVPEVPAEPDRVAVEAGSPSGADPVAEPNPSIVSTERSNERRSAEDAAPLEVAERSASAPAARSEPVETQPKATEPAGTERLDAEPAAVEAAQPAEPADCAAATEVLNPAAPEDTDSEPTGPKQPSIEAADPDSADSTEPESTDPEPVGPEPAGPVGTDSALASLDSVWGAIRLSDSAVDPTDPAGR